jgi:molybdate transport system substrate-binding protein
MRPLLHRPRPSRPLGLPARRPSVRTPWIPATLLLVVAACAPSGDREEGSPWNRGSTPGNVAINSILILAASDLAMALPEIARGFEAATGVTSDLVLGSSGNLAAQVEQWAPADLYLSADQGFVDRLEERGRLVPGTRRDYAVGPVTLLLGEGRAVPAHLQELADPAFQVIALANPEHAPYGRAAREAMERAGIWDRLAPRLVFAENVAQAAQFVRTGNADAGFVAVGLLRQEEGRRHLPLDPALHAPLVQAGAVVGGSRNPTAAAAFLEWLTAPEGQEVLVRFGFLPPPGVGPGTSSREAGDTVNRAP